MSGHAKVRQCVMCGRETREPMAPVLAPDGSDICEALMCPWCTIEKMGDPFGWLESNKARWIEEVDA